MIKKITRKNLEPFLSRHATEKRVLDIGSGGSSYARFFPNRVTVDIDPARKPDIVADAHHLPFNEEEFEVVLSTEMLEHVKDPFQVEREMRRVTAPGGVLILSTRFVFPIHDAPHDYWRFTKYGLQELFHEWELIELVSETGNFSTVGALLQRICFQSELKGGKLTKAALFFAAWCVSSIDWLTKREFGDIKRTAVERDLMPTGYYIVCRKKP
jgi:SAM-dependent methyltransferase